MEPIHKLSRRSFLRQAAGAIGGGSLAGTSGCTLGFGADRGPSHQHKGPASAVQSAVTADDFTRMFADKNDQTWSGGDQTTSFKAPNGRVYWLSGDTILSDGEDPDGSYPEAGTTMVANRILLQSGGILENAMANGGIGVPNPVTHTAENQERYWPQGAFQAGGYLYVLCQRVARDPTPGAIGFRFIGTEMARYRFAADGRLVFERMMPTPSAHVPGGVGPSHLQWAADAINLRGYVYIYGYTHAHREDPARAAHYSYVARVPTAEVEEPSAWRIYRKSRDEWVGTSGDLSTAIDNPDAIVASQISSVRTIAGKIVIAHKPWNGLGSTVYAEVGSRPEGPFSRINLFRSPAGTWEGRRYQTYGPMLHPEQILGSGDMGKLLVSINWNGQDFLMDVISNADLYKPRFHAVRLP